MRDLLTGGLQATRFGNMMIDEDSYLITQQGMRVQGFADPALTVIGDVRIDHTGGSGTGFSTPCLDAFVIQTDGRIVDWFADGSTMVVGQLLLQNFQNPSVLTRVGDQLFCWNAAAMPLPQPVPPGTATTGSLLVGNLEASLPELQMGAYAGPPQTFTQGLLVSTGIPTDIGIQGGGFFVLRRTNDNALFATRAGTFYLNGGGYLVHYSGLRLQGYTDGSQTTIGDLVIDTQNAPNGDDPSLQMASYTIDRLGMITVGQSDGTTFVRGQILLQGCPNPDLLTKGTFDLYPITNNTGLWLPAAPPISGNLGWIIAGAVELNQFDTNLVSVRSNLNFFCQGPLISTGDPANLAIGGQGFFTVRDPAADVQYATRLGNFQLDSLGHLVTSSGLRLQGLTNDDLTQCGDITIDTTGVPDSTLTLTSFWIDHDGQIQVGLSDGSVLLRGRILLQSYRNLQGLSPAGSGLYSNLPASLPIFTNGLSDYGPLGWIVSDYLEQPSGLPAPLQLPPPAGLRLFVDNISPLNWQLESSTDLRNWDVVGPICGSNLNEAEFFETSRTPQKFYRLTATSPTSGPGLSLPLASGTSHVGGPIGK